MTKQTLARRIREMQYLQSQLQASANTVRRMLGELLSTISQVCKLQGFTVDVSMISDEGADVTITWTKVTKDGIDRGEQQEIMFRTEQLEALGFRELTNRADWSTKHAKVCFVVR